MKKKTYLTSENIQQGPMVSLPTLLLPQEVPMIIAKMTIQTRIEGMNLIT